MIVSSMKGHRWHSSSLWMTIWALRSMVMEGESWQYQYYQYIIIFISLLIDYYMDGYSLQSPDNVNVERASWSCCCAKWTRPKAQQLNWDVDLSWTLKITLGVVLFMVKLMEVVVWIMVDMSGRQEDGSTLRRIIVLRLSGSCNPTVNILL